MTITRYKQVLDVLNKKKTFSHSLRNNKLIKKKVTYIKDNC